MGIRDGCSGHGACGYGGGNESSGAGMQLQCGCEAGWSARDCSCRAEGATNASCSPEGAEQAPALIHISEPTRPYENSDVGLCLKKKTTCGRIC